MLDGVKEDEIEDLLDADGVFSQIEELFPVKANTVFEEKMRQRQKEQKDAVRFLSKDKSRNINLAILPKIKSMPFSEVRQKIMQVDDAFCTEIFLSNLLAFAPTNDDDLNTMEKYLKKTDEECEELDLPEQLIIHMKRMYRYEPRLIHMQFRLTFLDRFDQLRDNMTVVLEASTSIRNSNSFKELLCLILTIGNYMNASGMQGGAFGLKIASINKLSDTKSSTASSVNLLGFLAGIVRKHFPHLLDFQEDLKEAGAAARISASINDVIKQYTELRQGLKQLDAELAEYWSDETALEPDDKFASVMTKYRTSAGAKFEQLETLYVNMDASWKDVIVYYGENPKAMRPDEFFSVFARFLDGWQKAVIADEKYKEKLEKDEQKRKFEEERKEKLKQKHTHEIESVDISAQAETGTDEDRRMMDNLLDKLRSGEVEARTRRRQNPRRKDTSNSDQPSTISDELETTVSALDLLNRLESL
ncbi:hypothetical protein NQZ79_g2242 [Umbelopsis isabellina]|nr:hypothetical protein NQZ79_g2242 [Umbelopsis isabellina]